MTNKKNTKKALLMSCLSLLLCMSMLVGTTFAWFTDEVTSAKNQIIAGNLDVELLYSKSKDFSEEKKVDGQSVLFTDKNGEEIEHWEPGVIAYSNFQVANVGTLALNYRLHMVFDNMNTVTHEGVQYDLSDVLKIAIVEGGFEGDRAAAKNLKFDYTLESFYLEGQLEGENKTETFGVVIYWAPGANEYDNIFNMNNGKLTDDGQQELRVDLGVNLFATQEEYEFDSFDDMYDEAAGKEIMAGEEFTISGNDIVESLENNGTLNVVGGVTDVPSYALENHGEANLKDVEVNAGNGGNYALISRGSDAVTTLDNVDVNAGAGGVAASEGAQVTINGGSVKVGDESTSGRYNIYAVGEGTVVTVNGGKYSFNTALKRAYIYAGAGAKVIVNGGDFGKASTRSGYTAGITGAGEVIIYGGTFKFDPSNWVAEGYKVTKEGSTWTVAPMASDNAGLNDAVADGEKNIALGAGAYTLPTTTGDMTISGTKDTVITINKPKAENVTLSGVTVVGSGNYTGIQHSQNVVFENCVVKGTQFLYADKVVFKNCVIDLSDKADYIWTYGAKEVEFINCTFETMGKAILIYSEASDLNTQVTVKGCTFNASQSALAGGATAAAIEIDSSLSTGGHYTLITENNTVDSDFAGEWRIKKSGTDNTTVNGVVYNGLTIG